MSVLLGANGSLAAALLQQTDDRVASKYCQWDFAGTRSQLDPWSDGMLWSRSRLGLGGADGYLNLDFSISGRYETDGFDFCGGQQRKKIVGVTRDANGTPLGSCVVQGFVTATDLSAGEVTSDTGGYYELCTSFTTAHYLVAYKPGSPDVAGTTVNTLIPV